MMSKKILWPVLIIITAIAIIVILFNIQFKKVNDQFSGMYVSNFIIQDGKTIPSLVEEQETNINIKLSLRRLFSSYSLSGEVDFEGNTYHILSSDIGNKTYVAAISSSKTSGMDGYLKISEDLRYYSLYFLESNYIVAPAQSKVEAEDIVHALYGEH